MRKLILAFLMLTVSFMIQAQKKAKAGIRIGANYSTLTNTYLDSKTGLYLGAFLNIQHSSFYALQPELTYSSQGANSRFFEDESVNINYISIGLTNKFFVMNDERFHLLVGVSIDLNLDYSFISLANNGWDSDTFFLDLGFYGGLGYQFDFGLILEARYKQGTIGVFTDEFFDDNNTRTNSLFQFGMAYKFNLKK